MILVVPDTEVHSLDAEFVEFTDVGKRSVVRRIESVLSQKSLEVGVPEHIAHRIHATTVELEHPVILLLRLEECGGRTPGLFTFSEEPVARDADGGKKFQDDVSAKSVVECGSEDELRLTHVNDLEVLE